MICEHCGASVPMVQQRFNMVKFQSVWVCMRCSPLLESHDGIPVRHGLSDEQIEDVRRMGWDAYRDKRREQMRERKSQKQKMAREASRKAPGFDATL